MSLLSAAILFVADCFWQIPAHAASPLLIGEVAWAGSSLSSADEWLELWNLSSSTLPLAGYKLRGAASSDIVFGDADSIPAYGTFIVSNYADTDAKSVLNTSVQIVTTTISLPNDKLKIQLVDPRDAVIDTAGDGAVPPAGSSSLKTSMIRSVDGNWFTAASAQNLDTGVLDLATPGICDGCVIPESDPEPVTEPDPVTTTEPLDAVSATTSNDILPLEPLAGTSSTEDILQPTSTQTTSTITLPVEETIPVTPASVIEAPAVAELDMLPPINLVLHAIFPAPSTGQEWIEIESPSPDISQAYGWSLKDGSSTIFRFQPSTYPGIQINGSIWHITLASAHLNNSGDIVELIRPDGSIAEHMVYPSTAHDKRWIKNENATAWILDPPNPAPVPEPLPAAQPTTVSAPILPTIELPAVSTTSTSLKEELVLPKPSPASTKTASKKTATAKTKTTVPKPKTASVKKITPVISLDTFDSMSTLESGVRIRLSGIVATQPGILAKQQFILASPDGHGLWVRASNQQASPKIGSRIQLEGTLMNNDDGIYLKLGTKDRWQEIKGETKTESRIVDLLNPDTDDAWSLMEATGTVVDVKGQTVELDLGDIQVQVKIKPVTGYRVQRIEKGDTLHVRGILDIRTDTPVILPSNADDITLTTHPKTPTLQNGNQVPDWLPFGAAGITIAMTESAKRLRRVYRDRKLRERAKLISSP